MKKAGGFILLFLGCILIYLIWPSNDYLRRALIHQHPKIDQYSIFENRIVEAGSPTPWQTSPQYNQHSIPEEFLPGFERYGTIAFLIIKDGELFFEQYWENYSPESHSNSFSMAKSIISLGIGCAIDDGFIINTNQPVSDFYPEFQGYDNIPLTIRHLLTMSAGVDFEEEYTTSFSPTTQLYYGKDLHRITFGMKEIEEPGKRFIYQSGVTQLLAYVLEKATGEPVSTYISRKLWTPMQAEENALWSLDKKDGMEKAYCCFNSNARDFARFGQLILNKGSWNNGQLIFPDYLQQAITPDTTLLYEYTNEPNLCYGYQFWYLTYQGLAVHYLRGILGQYVFAIPEKMLW
ncbi:MAG: beta-lactamase family protein [Tannerellaceae bacterium]|nr:beta-lactamase family protein [Tannerellaceae bacterium]